MNSTSHTDSILNSAQEHFEKGSLTKCLALLSSVDDDQKDIDHLNLLVRVYVMLNQITDAQRFHNLALSIDKSHVDVKWNEVRLKISQKHYSEALKLASGTLRARPEDLDGRLLYANCLRASGDLIGCEKEVKIILDTNGVHPEALALLGVIELTRNNKKSALNYFKKSFEIKPHLRSIWSLLINLAIELGELELAISSLSTIIVHDTNKKQWFQPLFACLNSVSNPEQRFDILLRIKKYCPEDFDITFALALAAKKANRFNDSLRYFTNAFELNSKNADLLHELALHKLRENKVDNAIELFKQAVQERPKFPQAHNNLGNAYALKNDINNALVAYETAISYDNGYAQAYNNIGLLHLDRNFSNQDISEAIKNFQFAIKCDPKIAAFYTNLGSALAQNKQWSDAVTAYSEGISLDPKVSETYNNLGNVYKQLGKTEKAIDAYCKSLEISSDSPNAAYSLATIAYEARDFKKMNDYLSVVASVTSNAHNVIYKQFPKLLLDKRVRDTSSYLGSPQFIENKGDIWPLIFHEQVNDDFVTLLKTIGSRKMEDTTDTRFGAGYCSTDFQFFRTENKLIEEFAQNLLSRVEVEIKGEILFHESFFNILAASGGTTPHSHLSLQDKDFEIGKQKYSLVYYLSVGDQTCSEPGILKLYEPDFEVLPYVGMCIVMPASQLHSAVYNGNEERILVGCNFYVA